MDKIEVGEYVRTKDGLIGKYERRKGGFSECIITDMFEDLEQDVLKHSKNIIDLIEVRRLCEWVLCRSNYR